ncbi:MAG: MBL fold metallo-hydrolase [Anaerolineales bacterium]
MKIEFWGVRGSMAVPGADYLEFGGNTGSIIVKHAAAPEHFLVLEAGTGLARFGASLDFTQHHRATVLLSHLSLYNIIGFQFTPFAFSPACQTRILGPSTRNIALESIFDLIMAPSFSPVYGRSNLMADVAFEEISPSTRTIEGYSVMALPFRHKSDADSWGYRISQADGSLAYISDGRLRDINGKLVPNALALAENVDVLVIGAFDPSFEKRHYCTYDDALELAHSAGARALVLTHHHPQATDDHLAQLEDSLQRRYSQLELFIANEGLALTL